MMTFQYLCRPKPSSCLLPDNHIDSDILVDQARFTVYWTWRFMLTHDDRVARKFPHNSLILNNYCRDEGDIQNNQGRGKGYQPKITLTETLIILDITKPNLIIVLLYIERKKLGSHVSASSLTAYNTNRAKLTWLPLEIMHCGHTWHDYPWPWHDYCIICSYGVTGADFENSLYTFGQSEKS